MEKAPPTPQKPSKRPVCARPCLSCPCSGCRSKVLRSCLKDILGRGGGTQTWWGLILPTQSSHPHTISCIVFCSLIQTLGQLDGLP